MEDICRGCLDKTEIFFSIFDLCERYDKSEKIDKMFSTISELEVKIGDGLPTQICYQCLENLSNAYQFRIQCRESHENLKENFLLITENCPDIEKIYLTDSRSEAELTKEEILETNEIDVISQEKTNILINNMKLNPIKTDEVLQYIDEEEKYDNKKEQIMEIKQEKSSTKKSISADFPCHDCKSSFTYRKELLQHIKRVHLTLSDNKIYCDICKRFFPSIQALSNHLQTHSKNNEIDLSGEKLKCSLCSRQFSHLILLSKHVEIFHKDDLKFCENDTESIICSICQTNCLTQTEYIQHTRACRLRNSDLNCQFCNKKFISDRAFMSHIAVVHNKAPKDSNKTKKFICHICNARYNSKVSLDQHLLLHEKRGEGENVPCPFCGKVFRTKLRVNTHIRAIHNKEKRHKCKFCDNEYFYGNALKVHELRHHFNKANYICNFCGKSFFAAGELNVHLRKHNNDSKYKCAMESCDKLFSQLSELKFHIRSRHTGERDFKCSNCDKTFITKQHLKQHAERNHPETPRQRTHICTICQNGFYTKSVLSKHIKFVHVKVEK